MVTRKAVDFRAVSSALTALADNVRAQVRAAKAAARAALDQGQYDEAEAAVARAKACTGLHERVRSIQEDWQKLIRSPIPVSGDADPRGSGRRTRLPKGQRTPQGAYRLPILRALDEAGGSGRMSAVLERVRQIMEPVLKPVDLLALPSQPRNPRWRNAAQWERNDMVREELLKADSPHGVWEITPAGRACLRRRR